MHFFREMQFASNCYTVASYQALFSLSVYKNSVVYLSGTNILCFCMIHDLGSPAISSFSTGRFEIVLDSTISTAG